MRAVSHAPSSLPGRTARGLRRWGQCARRRGGGGLRTAARARALCAVRPGAHAPAPCPMSLPSALLSSVSRGSRCLWASRGPPFPSGRARPSAGSAERLCPSLSVWPSREEVLLPHTPPRRCGRAPRGGRQSQLRPARLQGLWRGESARPRRCARSRVETVLCPPLLLTHGASPQRGAWKTTSWWCRCRTPWPARASSCSGRITPNTSSSKTPP